MTDHMRRDQMPELPDWLKRYDVSVGPYDQPVATSHDKERAEEDRGSHDDYSDDQT